MISFFLYIFLTYFQHEKEKIERRGKGRRPFTCFTVGSRFKSMKILLCWFFFYWKNWRCGAKNSWQGFSCSFQYFKGERGMNHPEPSWTRCFCLDWAWTKWFRPCSISKPYIILLWRWYSLVLPRPGGFAFDGKGCRWKFSLESWRFFGFFWCSISKMLTLLCYTKIGSFPASKNVSLICRFNLGWIFVLQLHIRNSIILCSIYDFGNQ